MASRWNKECRRLMSRRSTWIQSDGFWGRNRMEDDGKDGSRQLVVHLRTGLALAGSHSHRWVFLGVCSGMYVCGYIHLQPVKLCSQTALVHRVLKLHLEARQEVPPHWAGNRLTHHHSGHTEVHLTSHTVTQLTGETTIKMYSECECQCWVGGRGCLC